MLPRPNIAGLTAEQSASIHDWIDFLHEALDARDAILAFRRGSGPVAFPWPAWAKATPPAGVGPDLARWRWEDISARGKALCNAACLAAEPLGNPYDNANPNLEAAVWFNRMVCGHAKAYRLIRYAWFDTRDDEWRARMQDWAERTRAMLKAVPVETSVQEPVRAA